MEPKILVVEDNPETLDIVTITLEQNGYHVLVAADGLGGLAVALSESPQLIITDLKMPAMDGLEMIRELRRQAITRHIPIIAMSAYRIEHQTDAIMAGADRVLGKPFTPDMLMSFVRSLLTARSKGSS